METIALTTTKDSRKPLLRRAAQVETMDGLARHAESPSDLGHRDPGVAGRRDHLAKLGRELPLRHVETIASACELIESRGVIRRTHAVNLVDSRRCVN